MIVAAIILLMAIAWVVFYLRSAKRKRESIKTLQIQLEEKLNFKPDPLDRARTLLAAGDQVAFLKEMENVIWINAAEKLSIPSALLNQAKVMNEFRTRGESETGALFQELVNNCEASLYIPGTRLENLQDILDKSQLLMTRLDALAG